MSGEASPNLFGAAQCVSAKRHHFLALSIDPNFELRTTL